MESEEGKSAHVHMPPACRQHNPFQHIPTHLPLRLVVMRDASQPSVATLAMVSPSILASCGPKEDFTASKAVPSMVRRVSPGCSSRFGEGAGAGDGEKEEEEEEEEGDGEEEGEEEGEGEEDEDVLVAGFFVVVVVVVAVVGDPPLPPSMTPVREAIATSLVFNWLNHPC